jgi:hypothetical protein
MRPALLAIVLAVCEAACGRLGFDPTDDARDGSVAIAAKIPSWTSGTRLRAKVFDFGGGAIEHEGWFDSDLGIDCTVSGVGPDGIERCFPAATGNIVFADAGCTSPLATWNPSSGAAPAYGSEVKLVGGTFVRRHYPLGAELTGVMYYTGDPTSCQGPYPQATAQIFTAGAELDPATFAAVHAIRVGTGRLAQDGWESDDGSQYFDRLFDGQHQDLCTFNQTPDGLRCLTSADYAGTYFADAACDVPLAQPTVSGGANGIFYTEPCGVTRRYERGAPYTGSVYTLLGSVCSLSTATGLDMLGPELDFASYMEATETVGAESGRLVSLGLVAIDGTRVRRFWRDTMRGNERCGVSSGPAVAGTRCLPSDAASSLGDFSDGACTIPIVRTLPTCPASYIYVSDPRGFSVHAVEPSAAQPTQRFNYGFSCLGATFVPGSYVVGGPPLSFDSFALATERLE